MSTYFYVVYSEFMNLWFNLIGINDSSRHLDKNELGFRVLILEKSLEFMVISLFWSDYTINNWNFFLIQILLFEYYVFSNKNLVNFKEFDLVKN